MQLKTISLAALATTVSGAVWAGSDNILEASLGIGIVGGQSIYQGIDHESEVIPLFGVSYGNFYLEGLEAGFVMTEAEDFNLSVAIAGDTLDGERTDSSLLKDMGDVDSGVNLKLSGELFTNFGLLGASVAQDMSNEHEGIELSLSWAVPLEFDKAMLMPSVYATWMSDDLVNHYYGVATNQVKAGRPLYDADSGWRYGIELMAEYPLSQQWALQGGVSAEWYGDEITNSPIVDEDRAIFGFLGVIYQF